MIDLIYTVKCLQVGLGGHTREQLDGFLSRSLQASAFLNNMKGPFFNDRGFVGLARDASYPQGFSNLDAQQRELLKHSIERPYIPGSVCDGPPLGLPRPVALARETAVDALNHYKVRASLQGIYEAHQPRENFQGFSHV